MSDLLLRPVVALLLEIEPSTIAVLLGAMPARFCEELAEHMRGVCVTAESHFARLTCRPLDPVRGRRRRD
jgi:hypothetical protein